VIRELVGAAARFLKWTPEYTVWGIGVGKAQEVFRGLAETYKGGEKGGGAALTDEDLADLGLGV